MNNNHTNPDLLDDEEIKLRQTLIDIAQEEVTDNMDIWLNIETEIERRESPWHKAIQSFKQKFGKVAFGPPEQRRSTGITFAVSIAMTALVLVVMIAIATQPSGETSLSVQPIPAQQDTEVDCLADRAYRVVYAEELPGLTTEDLKCAFIVGDMRGLDISHLDFSNTVMRDVNMSGMELEGMRFDRSTLVNVNLREANLTGAWFSSANLVRADLAFADFTRSRLADINLQDAILSGANLSSAGLQGAVLKDADLSCADDLIEGNETTESGNCQYATILNRANLTDANLYGADLSDASLADATLIGADLSSTNLERAYMYNAVPGFGKLSDANLENAILTNADLDLSLLIAANINGVDLSNASMRNSVFLGQGNGRSHPQLDNMNFSQSNLNDTALLDLNMPKANLSGANLRNATLYILELPEANLIGADLYLALLRDVTLTTADLTNANLSRSDFFEVNLTGSDLTGVDLTDAAFTDVVWMDVTLPDGTLWTEETDLTRFTDADHPDYWRSDDPDSPAYGGEEE